MRWRAMPLPVLSNVNRRGVSTPICALTYGRRRLKKGDYPTPIHTQVWPEPRAIYLFQDEQAHAGRYQICSREKKSSLPAVLGLPVLILSGSFRFLALCRYGGLGFAAAILPVADASLDWPVSG